jgi:hypothetical protein
MNNDDIRNLIDQAVLMASAPAGPGPTDEPEFIRVSNDRYAKDSALDDRLSFNDKQMLSDMGIAF